MRKLITPICCLALFMIGCQDDDDIVQDIDLRLEQALVHASNGQGLDFFKLPDSDDYSAIPQDPRNPITQEKVELGKFLYHETAMAIKPIYGSGTFTYSCASCHHADAGFQAGRNQGIADGGLGFGLYGEGREPNPAYPLDSLDVQPIRSPTVLNTTYQEVTLWNGQFGAKGMNAGTESEWTPGTPKEWNTLGYEGVETQAIAGIHVHRMSIDSCAEFFVYKDLFDDAFPEFAEDERVTNITAGLAIAAYERTILANQAPFQQWLRGDYSAMTNAEKEGAVLFFGKGQCSACHTGPALNSMTFYALGMKDLDGPGIYGTGLDDATKMGRGGFTKRPEDMFKFKTPQLYSLVQSPFYGHGASFSSIRRVIEYKNAAVPENPDVPGAQLAEEFVPLDLTDREIEMITAFIVRGLNDDKLRRYVPESLPSGNCFPNNDEQSQHDLGCN